MLDDAGLFASGGGTEVEANGWFSPSGPRHLGLAGEALQVARHEGAVEEIGGGCEFRDLMVSQLGDEPSLEGAVESLAATSRLRAVRELEGDGQFV